MIIASLQPSLHQYEEFVRLVVDITASLRIDTKEVEHYLATEGVSNDEYEIDECMNKLDENGYFVHYEDDAFIIHETADVKDCGRCEDDYPDAYRVYR